ncbi:MAG: DUF1501 domain-containing protein, partial [Acidobacteria bacterium]|nr:DUF1501 domain-containing protein [Acidobacteriota bacterium]
MKTTRRGFLMGCSAAIAAMAGSRIHSVAFGDTAGGYNEETLVVIFLRGGMDGLNLVAPIDGADRGFYEAARPHLQLPVSGAGAALALDAQFGLHPAAAPLHDLWQNGSLGIVHAIGMTEPNRSHFDAMEFIELGTPGVKSTTSGWLARHLSSAQNLPLEIVMPSLAVGDLQPTSLLGDRETINLTDPGQFRFSEGPWLWRNAQRTALRAILEGGSTILHQSATQALDAVDIIELYTGDNYVPANGAVYPSGSFGDDLQVVAQMIKLGLGLRIVTLDLGGWDTHESQGDGSGGYFAGLVAQLAEGLGAFYLDLDGAGSQAFTQKLTVVVQSEFGRRFAENGDHGCDHGHGNTMLVLGGHVNGGFHGSWPGLAPGQLYEGIDLAVTTDYRRVLSEILIRRLGNNQLGTIFPGYGGYSPLGVVQGTDLPPDYSGGRTTLFA